MSNLPALRATVLVALLAPSAAAALGDARALLPEQAVERPLAVGKVHVYRLDSDGAFRLIVEQLGINLSVE